MPGKYSHGLVLAHYSGQGILSLPNDDYLKLPVNPRPSRAAASSSRTLSTTTKSPGHASTISPSIKSTGRVPLPTTTIFTESETPTSPRRIVIIDSDSDIGHDDTASQDEEWVRPHSKPAPQATSLDRPKGSAAFRPQSAKAPCPPSPPGVPHTSPSTPQMKGLDAQRSPYTPKTPGKRGGGVRALIQARNEVEKRMIGITESTGKSVDGKALSLKEVLQTGPTTGGQRRSQLTVQQFLDKVPDPHDEQVTDESDTNERTIGKAPAIIPDSEMRSAYGRQKTRNQELLAQPSFDDVDDTFHSTATLMKKTGEGEGHADVRAMGRARTRHQLDPAIQCRDTPTRSLKHSGASPHKTKSSMSSYSSGLSSNRGKSSFGTATQATSGYSPSPRTANNAKAEDGRELLTLDSFGGSGSFADVLRNINNMSMSDTSEREEENDQHEDDFPTPKLQSIPERELFASQWGTISAGQNVLPRVREEDELSQDTAIFPPDIGRFRYAETGEGPLAMVLRGEMVEDRKAGLTGSLSHQKGRNDGLMCSHDGGHPNSTSHRFSGTGSSTTYLPSRIDFGRAWAYLVFIMPDIYRHLVHVFCCMPQSRNGDNHNSESLSTLPAPPSAVSSPLSVPIPHDTVPQGSSESNTDDARTLHHIFSSSSSVRGYQTAATTPAFIPTSRPSLDHDFKFGSDIPKRRPKTPIEKIGRHIRQKLSQSRITRASTNKDAGLEKMGQSSPLKHDVEAPLGKSQSTAGLTEILASRTASQGGYDSDAHTIASPLVRSNAGTIKVSAGFVKQALGKLEHDEDTAGTAPTVPSAQGKSGRTVRQDFTSRSRVQSAPIPATPSKTSSFIAELRVGTNKSPSDVLRRLSVGVAKGTIKMPSSPDTRGIQVFSVDESGSPLHLSAPPRTSSMSGLDPKAREKLKRLSDKFVSVKRDSMLSVNENQRESLLSELDPALVEYIGKFAEGTATAQPNDAKQDGHTHGQGDLDGEPDPPVEVSIRQPGEEAEMWKPVIHSTRESDSDSVHLFNMRISQRLASQSQLPFSSPVASNNASTKSLTTGSGINPQAFGQGSITNLTRYPTLIASEHNRRPSDPETKKLFEAGSSKKRSNAPSTWKSVTSVHSGNKFSDAEDKSALTEPDDANSSCWSDGDVGDSRVSSPLAGTRRSSIQNPHSLAVGGRSVCGRFSNSTGVPTSSQVMRASQSVRRSQRDSRDSADSQNAPNQHPRPGRSASMPQKKQTRQASSPTPVPRYLRGSTDIAENISEVSLERILDRRNEGMTEISAQEVYDKRNEQLSEVDHRHLFVPHDKLSPSRHKEKVRHNSSPHSLGGELHRSRSRPPASLQRSLSEDAPGSIRECGTVAWERAFRQAEEDTQVDSAGYFLTAPKYDRDGRLRRSLGTSVSDEGSPLGQRASAEARQRWSQSVGYSRRRSSSADVDAHQQMCSAAKGALPRSGPAINTINRPRIHLGSYTMKEMTQPRKRSILEIRRKFTSVSSTPSGGKSNSPASLKDLLGIWGRFPSHTREERNGAATAVDNVAVQDFLPSAIEAGEDFTPGNALNPDSTPLNMSAFKRLQLKANRRMERSESKSMTLRGNNDMFLSSAERARRSRKGILGKWKRLQRSSSSELRKYTNVHGHRSSLSVGDRAEYPELECLPGEGLLRETDLQKRQGLDCSFGLGIDGGPVDEMTPPDHADRIKHKERPDWARAFGNCVGSLSALRSDTDGEGMSMSIDKEFAGRADREDQNCPSLEVRKSTLDFHRQLVEDQAKARIGLNEKLEQLGKSKTECEVDDKADNAAAAVGQESQSVEVEKSKQERPSTDIKIPGGFGS